MADLYAMAADLLDRVCAHIEATGATLPTPRYVAPGDWREIAYDGPAVQVNVDSVAPGRPGADISGNQRQRADGTAYAQFTVTILRTCATADEQGNPPTPAAIQADAQAAMADAGLLAAALAAARDSSLAPGGWAARGGTVLVGQVRPVGPAGSLAGTVGTIQAVLL